MRIERMNMSLEKARCGATLEQTAGHIVGISHKKKAASMVFPVWSNRATRSLSYVFANGRFDGTKRRR